MAFCRYHPDRPGIGVCIRCRVVICTACCTKVEGINHCHACLQALAQRRGTGQGGNVGSVLGALAVLGLGWLIVFVAGLLGQGLLSP